MKFYSAISRPETGRRTWQCDSGVFGGYQSDPLHDYQLHVTHHYPRSFNYYDAQYYVVNGLV